jgi:hypothetical protein
MSNGLQHALSVARYVYPQMRLGQILVNAVSTARPECSLADLHQVLFYVSDVELARMVMQYTSTVLPKAAPVESEIDGCRLNIVVDSALPPNVVVLVPSAPTPACMMEAHALLSGTDL